MRRPKFVCGRCRWSGGPLLGSLLPAAVFLGLLLRLAVFLLGLFLLAVSGPRVKQPAALMGFVVGVTGLSLVAVGTDLYWPWYAAVGSLLTWLAAWVIQLLTPGDVKQGNEMSKGEQP